MPGPAVTVLVATLGENPLLPEALRQAQEQAAALPAEVLLVVNAPEAAFPAAYRDAWRALAHRVLFEERSGKSHALNRGVAEARGAIVAFLDDDATPAPRWLESITAPLRAGASGVAGCGGRVLPVYPAGGPPEWYRRIVARGPSTFLGPYHDLGPLPQEYRRGIFLAPFGANCAYRRELLLQYPYRAELGPSRATGLRGGEDTEVACRLRAHGWRLLYCPDAVVYHPVEPARMTRDYVARGYYIQGVENVRMRRILGEVTIAAGYARVRLARSWARWALASLLRRRSRHRLAFRVQFHRGQIQEILRPGARP
ncbi:MAG: glycosyltransferase [Planctomycetota bacterium]|nr:MAG: glycosyltransferase [Planctomycetota bacterium]